MSKYTFYDAVYKIVGSVPRGQVATYGSIATWLGAPRAARAVGYALAADFDGSIPWHRIVNARGGISEGGAPHRPIEQRSRLEAEGLHFSDVDSLDLRACHFHPTKAQLRRWLALGRQIMALRGDRDIASIRA